MWDVINVNAHVNGVEKKKGCVSYGNLCLSIIK